MPDIILSICDTSVKKKRKENQILMDLIFCQGEKTLLTK